MLNTKLHLKIAIIYFIAFIMLAFLLLSSTFSATFLQNGFGARPACDQPAADIWQHRFSKADER